MRSEAFTELLKALLLNWPREQRKLVGFSPGKGMAVSDHDKPIELRVVIDIPGKLITIEGGN